MNDVLEKFDSSMTEADGAFDGAWKAVKELPGTTKTSECGRLIACSSAWIPLRSFSASTKSSLWKGSQRHQHRLWTSGLSILQLGALGGAPGTSQHSAAPGTPAFTPLGTPRTPAKSDGGASVSFGPSRLLLLSPL